VGGCTGNYGNYCIELSSLESWEVVKGFSELLEILDMELFIEFLKLDTSVECLDLPDFLL